MVEGRNGNGLVLVRLIFTSPGIHVSFEFKISPSRLETILEFICALILDESTNLHVPVVLVLTIQALN